MFCDDRLSENNSTRRTFEVALISKSSVLDLNRDMGHTYKMKGVEGAFMVRICVTV